MHGGQERKGNDLQLKKFSTIIDKHKKRIEEQRAPSHLVQVKVSSLLQDPGASPSAPIVLWCFRAFIQNGGLFVLCMVLQFICSFYGYFPTI